MKINHLYLFIAIFIVGFTQAQIGIGTIDPDASSMIDIKSSEKGALLPRMTTAQRTAISSPANGLTVFDTDEQSYFFYNESDTKWESLNSSRSQRDNYVLVKSEADLPAPSGGTITLDSNTFYSINGIIDLTNPIEINGAYISGFDSFEDGFTKATGDIFVGSTGGSIRFLSLSGGGKAFNITGGTSLIVQNSIFSNFNKVGDISNVGLVFFNITQYLGNTNGFTYKDITNLLLSNSAWQGDNTGTFEKFEGSFDLVQKGSGFSQANGTTVAIDVSANPTVGNGVITNTTFTGTSTTKVNKYTTTSANVNFTKEWFVQAPGIQDEYDDIATGNIFFDGDLNLGYGMSLIDVGVPVKLTGGAVTSNLLRFSSDANNKLIYKGDKKRSFSVSASLSVRGTNDAGSFYSFFIRKNGTETLNSTNSIFYVTDLTAVSSVSITGTVTLAPTDYVEIWCEKLSGANDGSITIFSQNLNID